MFNDTKKDIEKYTKIWDSITKEEKAKKPSISNFFGQINSESEAINESDCEEWRRLSRIAQKESISLNEESKPSIDDIKNNVEKMANAHNPILPTSIGKDQDVNVTQNWGVGGEKYAQLSELKLKLHDLESKLSTLDVEGVSSDSVQSKIDNLRKEIDNLSDSLNGNRFSND